MNTRLHRLLLLLLLGIFLFPVLMQGQTPTENYVKTSVYKVATATEITAPTPAQATVSVGYFDALGRPILQVAAGQSASGKDILTPFAYDSYGRATKDYLPYPSTTATMAYDANAITGAATYYANTYGAANTNPYSEKAFEASPLNRVLKQAAPGADWKLATGTAADHSIKYDYQANTDADAVKLFRANAVWSETLGYYTETPVNPTGTVFYAAGELSKTIIKDENWTAGKNNTTEEYTNKKDRSYSSVPLTVRLQRPTIPITSLTSSAALPLCYRRW